jgi:hypothetical protein
MSAAVGAKDAHRFFDEKVAGVRASTDDAPLVPVTLKL